MSYGSLMDAPLSSDEEGAQGFTWQNWTNVAAYVVNVGATLLSSASLFGEQVEFVSKKYQTLVTPVAWAFAIWGPIFLWEGIFVVAQMLPAFRRTLVPQVVAPFWLTACVSQALWYVAWQREWIFVSFVFIFADLGGLLAAMFAADRAAPRGIAASEWWLLRAPFSLHAGWLVAANVVSLNVSAVYLKADPSQLLALANASLALVAVVATMFGVAYWKPDCILCFVASWALMGIYVELKNPVYLLDPDHYNPFVWPSLAVSGVSGTAGLLALLCVALAIIGAVLRLAPPSSTK